MVPPFDIFRAERDGDVLWLESATDLEAAWARVKMLAASTPGEYLILSQMTGRRISFKSPSKKVIFQIGYEARQTKAREEMLRSLGYKVFSVVGNPAAELELTSGRLGHVDLFIVGDLAPDQTRKEMLRWLKARYPKIMILALQPSDRRQSPMRDADFSAVVNGSDEWLNLVASAVG